MLTPACPKDELWGQVVLSSPVGPGLGPLGTPGAVQLTDTEEGQTLLEHLL